MAEDSQDEEDKKVMELVRSLHGSIDEDHEDIEVKPLEDIDKRSEDSVDLNDVQIMSEPEDSKLPKSQEQGEEGERGLEEGRAQYEAGTEGEGEGRSVKEELSQPSEGSLSLPRADEVAGQDMEKLNENIEQDEGAKGSKTGKNEEKEMHTNFFFRILCD